MRYGLVFVALILLQAFNAASSQSRPGNGLPILKTQALARTRMLIAQDADSTNVVVTASLADGASLELKSIIGGAILRVQKEERGEVVESSIQSISNNEAANLRELIANAESCPVELTFMQDQLVQAKPVCK